ncbi:acetoacetate decarboxylase family protein [Dactylosporangium fulvum]|uniref:Acetoacetate decarboxylase family protein n=1 Tax=Dactylosporangium fulvum TaxID=53359 RepID=A0ABY5WAM3_9ACTN|nr:acetoacetate decarboxylase family protein [Dactylosporangium fulvum]UWP85121.1 acetoacetate decarboxylase family protein [Dactylosporangium fulvum]
MAYPPEPWSLRGRMFVSVWVLPAAAVPALPGELAGAVHVVRCAGRAVVGTAWVDYRPGGDMTYRELLAATLVRAGARPRVTISHIWVDSVDSRDGGRELWGIPKELAELAIGEGAAEAAAIASASLHGGTGLPVRLPVAFRVVQALAAKVRTTPVRATARYGTARVGWRVAPDGPLGFLAGRRPLLSVVADDFRMRFGTAQPAVDRGVAR